ncbi:WW domain-binding protein 11-like [Mesoplodon densirostris]|uniref:WW domain-binding protein 11-like n=1 Tax=Mesoplodon densirostris TaxID=48708 RepID=UPI0028DCC435|nr:WW domain-binding protein 11-like [Mesoplodon densirostris]
MERRKETRSKRGRGGQGARGTPPKWSGVRTQIGETRRESARETRANLFGESPLRHPTAQALQRKVSGGWGSSNLRELEAAAGGRLAEEEGTREGGRVGIAACGGRRSLGPQRRGEAELRSLLNADRARRQRGRRAGAQTATESGSEAAAAAEGEPASCRAVSPSRAVAAQGRLGQHTHTHIHTQPERALAANRQHGAGAPARARAAAAATRELLSPAQPPEPGRSRGAVATCPEALSPPPPPPGPEPTPRRGRPRGQPAGSRRRGRRASGLRAAGDGKLCCSPRFPGPAPSPIANVATPLSSNPAHLSPPTPPPVAPPRRLDSAPGKTSKRLIAGSLLTPRLGISGNRAERGVPTRPARQPASQQFKPGE